MKRYSIGSLLLVTAFIALALAFGISRTKLAKDQEELRVLLAEYRLLDHSQPEKIRAIGFHSDSGHFWWRWRIALPAGKKFSLNISTDKIPLKGLPESFIKHGESFASEMGEFVLDVSASQDGDKGFISVNSCSLHGKHGVVGEWRIRPAKDWLNALREKGVLNQKIGDNSTSLGSPDEPFVLLRLRHGLDVVKQRTVEDPAPTDGIMIWLEAEK